MKWVRAAQGAAASLAVALSACAASGQSLQPESAVSVELAPQRRDCPQSVAAIATCYTGRDRNGSFYLIAMPRDWNRVLVVHAHGGPRMSPPQAEDSDEDLDRFAIMVRSGYAWIGSTYRREGYAVRRAAEDVDNSRALFWRAFGRPDRTLLHGQSWGAQVAAKAAELYPRDEGGRLAYDGVLLTNGVLGGGTRSYGFRADLRAVYQYYCRNHPRLDEAQYPVWMGLAPDATLTRNELRARVDACTGVSLPAGQRTAQQASNLANILGVTGVQEGQLLRHLEWATFTFRSLVDGLGGRNPFDNSATVYSGSSDDRALNAGIERFAADPVGLSMLAHDADPTGEISAPTISLHAVGDPVAAFALEADYARVVANAGRSHLLVQVAVDWNEHARLPDDVVAAALQALDDWARGGERPDAAAVRDSCLARGSAALCPI